jgi:hypothetical protein
MHGRFLTAYIDLPFLEKLFSEKPDDIAGSPFSNWPETWLNVYRFLQKNAKIVIGAGREAVTEQPILTHYLFGEGDWRHVECRPNLAQEYFDPASVTPDDPFSVYLFENPNVPVEELRDYTGLLFLRHDDLETDWLRLFDEHVLNVLPGSDHSFQWADFRPHANPLNAIVIADKYAYSQFMGQGFEQNLGSFLCAVIPEGPLVVPFHITLLTDLQTPYEENGPHPNDIHDTIECYLESRRPELDIHITVASYKGNDHKDRFIFTNYGVFSSNDSFTFLKNGKLSKETLVKYFPNGTQGDVVTKKRLQRISELCNEPLRYGRDRMIMASGYNDNRLLETVT